MIDIFPPSEEGLDLGTYNTAVARAKNILSVHIGSLEYADDLGIDLKFFLSEDFKFQDESFKAYLIETLAYRGINVTDLAEAVESLFRQYTFNLAAEESTSGLIAR